VGGFVFEDSLHVKTLLATASSGSRGGGEIYLLYLGRALAERGHEPVLWASNHRRMDELARLFASIGEVIRSDYRNTYDHPTRVLGTAWNRATSHRVAREWEALQPDIVHINKQNLEDGLDLLRAARETALPRLATIHLTQSAAYLGARFAAVRDHFSRSALVDFEAPLVAIMERRRDDLAAFVDGAGDVRLVMNGVPCPPLEPLQRSRAAMRKELSLDEDEILVIAVGRMVEQKRPMEFLKIAAEVVRTGQRVRFHWVGDGAHRAEWDRFVSRNNLTGSVSCSPWQQEVTPFLAAADAFLHVAEYEGLPLALLEAMAAGVPAVVTPNLRADMPFLNAGNSIAAVGSEWLRIVADPSERRRIGAEGRRMIEERFSTGRMAAEYEQIYTEVCAR
jgi:glycosyltransferase involved in cell wall biosynthesis